MPIKKEDNNIDRFSGFADYYDRYRPQSPSIVPGILINYLGKRPSLVIDLGSGTGLSTFIWKDYSEKVIGIEPNRDMLKKAQEKLNHYKVSDNVSFKYGLSNQTGIDPETVDIIICSQSLHWMEPLGTLEEAFRILIKGGVFAAFDCDWPPTVDYYVEESYKKLLLKADNIIRDNLDSKSKVKKWDKSDHLKNMEASGKFRFVKEIVFHNWEKSDSDRYIGLALSQGALQTVFKMKSGEIEKDIHEFEKIIEERFSNKTLDILFSYRLRVGIK